MSQHSLVGSVTEGPAHPGRCLSRVTEAGMAQAGRDHSVAWLTHARVQNGAGGEAGTLKRTGPPKLGQRPVSEGKQPLFLRLRAKCSGARGITGR